MGKKKTTGEFKNEIEIKFNGEFTVLGEYEGSKIKIKMKHNSKECNFHVFDAIPSNMINRGDGCPICRYKKSSITNSMTMEECQNKLNNVYKIDEFIILGGFIRAAKKAKVKHECGFIWQVRVDHIMNRSSGCPMCSEVERRKKKSVSQLIAQNRLDKLYGMKEYEILGDYKGSTKKATVRHSCGHTWQPFINNLLKGEKVCPNCSPRSKGNQKIENYLITNSINYKREHSFPDCKFKNLLRFDFAIFDELNKLKCLIEFDGMQHFKPVKSWGGEEILKIIQKRDKKKNDYCFENGIPLLRISYENEHEINNILYEYFKDFQITV